MGRGGSREIESKPRRLVITEKSVFTGSDGICLTPFGSEVHKLIMQSNFLREVRSLNGGSDPLRMVTPERRVTLEEEVMALCFNLGMESTDQAIDAVAQKFKAVCDARMPKIKDLFRQTNGSR